LFEGLGKSAAKAANPQRAAVLNRDDASFGYLSGITPVQQLSYGMQPEANVRAERVVSRAHGLSFLATGSDLRGEPFSLEVRTNLVGEYNVWNCLAAVALGRGVMGLDETTVARGIAALLGIPGRMERIDEGQDFMAIVDFAHTPNALRRALESARTLTRRRVIAVFGSAGLRDREKRRLMAQTSIELADFTLLTAEDPRTESLDLILSEMATGAESKGGVEGRTFWRVRDRAEALRFALRLAQDGDLVVVCGKGHEQSMCFGEIEYPWDDRTAMRAALAEYLGVPGPQMPYLPTQNDRW
jgi:UDP-N-acetylmuramoyl-L-alanyl-D-glutamate--2,6-diaminopimelate ligase